MTQEEFLQKFEVFADIPGAVAKMRELILRLAVRGKLVDQVSTDEPGEQLRKRLQSIKSRLIGAGRIRPQLTKPVGDKEALFNVPASWVWMRLGEIGDWGSGSTPRRGEPDLYGPGVTWLKSGELNDNQSLSGSEETVTDLALTKGSFRRNRPGDVLLAMYGATIGRVAILAEPAVTNQAVCGCTPFEGIYNRYLFNFLLSQRERFHNAGEGGAQPNISKVKILAFPFPLPPFAEQQRIVAKVDELMALCDRLEAQEKERETRHAALARASLSRFADAPTPANLTFLFHKSYTISPADLRKSILTLAVQGKLVESDPAEQTPEALLEQMKKLRQQLVDEKKIRKPPDLLPVSEDELPFSIHDSWRWVRWGHICDWITYGFTRPMSHVKNGPPIVTAKNVQDGFMTFENAHRASPIEFAALNPKDLPRKGDILITKDGTIGRAALVETDEPFCINQSVAVLWLESCLLYRPFLLMVIRSPFGQDPIWEAAEGMAIKHLSITDFGRMILPIPPFGEQRRIVAKVDELMALVDELETQLATSRTTAAKLLNAILGQLTG
ncbi:MAG TPA: restriction endonuclease subunit S [Thermoanaerobaculia bacterium]|nr:restriction endonuclease subunit S [Thermoanaerobaculia bacterium]